MFDVGDLPVLTFGNFVLKPGVINGLWNYMYVYYVLIFFSESNDFLRFFFSCYTRFLEHCYKQPMSRRNTKQTPVVYR